MTGNLTIIIPAFNEQEAIENTIVNLKSQINSNEFEIIVVNDGSSDYTGKVLAKIEGIKVINHPYNKGYGAALKTGIKSAETEYIAFYDSDGQHKPIDLLNLWNNRANYDMLVGKRGNDSHVDWIRKPGKWVLAKVANFLTGRKIPDLNSGLRVIKREAMNKVLHLLPDGFSLSTTSTVAFFNLGYNVGYFPIKVVRRIGKSSVNQVKHGPQTLLLILRLIVLFNPLKIFLPVSIFLFIWGTFYEIIYGIILHPGIKLLPAALFYLISSIIIFFFGLVVDQISELRKHLYDHEGFRK